MTNPRNIIKAAMLCLVAMLGTAAAEAQEKRVAILEPEGNAGVTPMNKKLVRGVVREIIVSTKVYKSVARNDASIDAMLKEQKFQRSHLSDTGKAKKLGDMLGADLICSMELHTEKDEILIDCDIVDVETGDNLNAGIVHVERYSNAAIKAALEPKIYQMLGIGASAAPGEPGVIRVTGISLNKNSLSLEVGKTETLVANVRPDFANDKNVQWTSSNANVARVGGNGAVMAVGSGTASITVKADDGGFSATCNVTVTVPIHPIVAEIKGGKKRNLKFGPYTWRVLEVQGSKVLLITEDVIETRAYHSVGKSVTWETCDLRRYFNGPFLQKFSGEEQRMILETQTPNPVNAEYKTDGGDDTVDKVFIFNIEEARRYFNNDANRGTGSRWWLRSPGNSSGRSARVLTDGSINTIGTGVTEAGDAAGLRPAIWINLQP